MGEKGAKLTEEATRVCDELVNSLSALGNVTSKKMFGGHGVFESNTMFALVTSQAEVYFKVDDSNRALFERIEAKQHGKMPYFHVPGHILQDKSTLLDWAKKAIRVAHISKK